MLTGFDQNNLKARPLCCSYHIGKCSCCESVYGDFNASWWLLYPKKNRQNKAYLFRSKKPINCRPRGILHMARFLSKAIHRLCQQGGEGILKNVIPKRNRPNKVSLFMAIKIIDGQPHGIRHMTRGPSYRIKVPHFGKRPFTNYVNSLRGKGSLKNIHITL